MIGWPGCGAVGEVFAITAIFTPAFRPDWFQRQVTPDLAVDAHRRDRLHPEDATDTLGLTWVF
jgi:hypothetical protein